MSRAQFRSQGRALSSATQCPHVAHSRREHYARVSTPQGPLRARLTLPPSPSYPSGPPRHCPSPPSHRSICSWLLLARPRLSTVPVAEEQRLLLEGKDSRQSSARREGSGAIGSRRLAPNHCLGVRNPKSACHTSASHCSGDSRPSSRDYMDSALLHSRSTYWQELIPTIPISIGPLPL